MSSARIDGRSPKDLRPLSCTWDIAPQAVGSVLLKCGKTEVICTASVDEAVPRWMKEQGVAGGWLTAEYSMLPASTSSRKPRDSSRGKVDGRSTEIQRLLGRSLRAVTDLTALGPRSLWIDAMFFRRMEEHVPLRSLGHASPFAVPSNACNSLEK